MQSPLRSLVLLAVISIFIAAIPAPRAAAQTVGFSGAIPPPNSVALLATTDPIAPAQLTALLNAAGCNSTVLAIHPSDGWQVYVVGAPALINADFPALLDAQAPFFVRCGQHSSAFNQAATWIGNGRRTLDTFSVPQGDWEYCAELVSAPDIHSGVRVSLYNNDGFWLSSDSGTGGVGSLGCTSMITQPDLLELRVFALDEVSWSVTVRPRSDEPAGPQLAYWSSAPTAIAPAQTSADGVLFAADTSEVTRLFSISGTELSYCVTLVESPTDLTSATPRMTVTILFEDEPGQVSDYAVPSESLAIGDQTCVDTEVRQPGRYRLLIEDLLAGTGWELLVSGAS